MLDQSTEEMKWEKKLTAKPVYRVPYCMCMVDRNSVAESCESWQPSISDYSSASYEVRGHI